MPPELPATYDTRQISERIRLLMKVRGWSARQLARESEMYETAARNLVNHLDEKPGHAVLATLLRIAEGARVSAPWLIFGIGEMELPTEAPDPNRNRAAATAFARANGLRPDAIAEIRRRAAPEGPGGLPPHSWYALIQARALELDQADKFAGDAVQATPLRQGTPPSRARPRRVEDTEVPPSQRARESSALDETGATGRVAPRQLSEAAKAVAQPSRIRTRKR
jgi:hypothetical protein